MGSSFDFFGDVSHHNTSLLPQEYIEKRNFLCRIMTENGFVEYDQEWWHYRLKNELFPNTYFDFDVY